MRSIRKDDKYKDVILRLAERADKDGPNEGRTLFPTMRELLCFAAALGFQTKRRIPIGNEVSEVDWRVWERSPSALEMLYMIGLADRQDVGVLHPDREEQLITIFEEYASGGLETLSEWLLADAGDSYGDRAILAGMRRHGLMGDGIKPVDQALRDLKF